MIQNRIMGFFLLHGYHTFYLTNKFNLSVDEIIFYGEKNFQQEVQSINEPFLQQVKLLDSNFVFNSQTNRGENRKTISSAFFITDRKNGTTYKCPMTSSFFAGIIHGYVINLEKERVKNK